MYWRHFGLTGAVLCPIVDPGSYIPLPSREAALKRAGRTLGFGRGPIALYGESGSGLSLLGRVLAQRWGGRTLIVDAAKTPPRHLIETVAAAFGGTDFLARGPAATLQKLRSLARRVEPAPLLILDHAETFVEQDFLQYVEPLMALGHAPGPCLRVAILSGPRLWLRLPDSLTTQWADRILIPALPREESDLLLLARLQSLIAKRSLFGPEALDALWFASRGRARALLGLAEQAMGLAAGQGLETVPPRMVALAAVQAAVEAPPASAA